ncbi:MAG TPA: hypothetical protein VK116_00015, partial [Planctomycetota bacterium]|nr:hypothetical protein [Planctomycetota bacterium]
PIAVEVQGQTVYLCCEGCRAKLEASQDEYLQKIDDAKAAAERAESEVRGSANETIDSLEEAARDATN